MFKKVLGVVILLTGLGALGYAWWSQEEKFYSQKLDLLRGLYEKEMDELADRLLVSMLDRYPDKPEILLWLDRVESRELEKKRAAQRAEEELLKLIETEQKSVGQKLSQMERDFLRYQNSTKSWQENVSTRFSVTEAAKAKPPEADLLNRLTGEKAAPGIPDQTKIRTQVTQMNLAVDGKDWGTALERSLEILRQQPDHKEAAVIYAQASLVTNPQAAEARTQAVPVLEAILKDNPKDWKAAHTLGLIYQKEEMLAQAELRLLDALELRPDDPEMMRDLLLNYLKQGDYTSGAPWVERLWKVKKTEEVGILTQEFIRGFESKSVPQGIFQEWAQLSPNQFQPPYYLGLLSWEEGRPQEALEYFQQALTLHPTKELWKRTAGIQEALSQWEEAAGSYRKYLDSLNLSHQQDRRDYEETAQNLLLALMKTKKYDRVLTEGFAVQKTIGSPAYLPLIMGQAAYLGGEYAKAVDYLRPVVLTQAPAWELSLESLYADQKYLEMKELTQKLLALPWTSEQVKQLKQALERAEIGIKSKK